MNPRDGSNPIRFYRWRPNLPLPIIIQPAGTISHLWRPSGLSAIFPPGFHGYQWLLWRIADLSGVFRNPGYRVHVVAEATTQHSIHRACVFPPFFRFPFMGRHDLQIGYVWTDDHWRSRGVATWSICEVLRQQLNCQGAVWYLTEEGNQASIRLIERAGFVLVGTGRKVAPLGVNALSRYQVKHVVRNPQAP